MSFADGDSWVGNYQSLHRCPGTVARNVAGLLDDGVGAAFIIGRDVDDECRAWPSEVSQVLA